MGDTMAGRGFGSGRKQNDQALDDDALLAAAQIIQPDQAEAEDGRGIHAIGCSGDGGDTGLSFPQECARVTGRQAVLEGLLGADFGELPARELAGAETAPTSPEEPGAAPPAPAPPALPTHAAPETFATTPRAPLPPEP